MCNHDYHRHTKTSNKKGLLIALIITTFVFLLELVGGIVSNSIALLSDSSHMLLDVVSLAIAFAAIHYSIKKDSKETTKAELYAALTNGVLLIVVCFYIIFESADRLLNPIEIQSNLMIVVAIIGLIANLMAAYILMQKGDVKNNLNIRGAYLHVIGDLLGSLAVIFAGLLIYLFNWTLADPLSSSIFAIIILKNAFQLTFNSIKELKKMKEK